MKDKFFFMSKGPSLCRICDKNYHMLSECPLLFYNPNKILVIGRR
jgi:hypothetical protein